MCKFKVGDYVYKPFQPQKPGKVINTYVTRKKYDNGNIIDYLYCTVNFLDGKQEDIWELRLKSFDALIADHKKKLSTHLITLAKLNALP
jgi:hypothetical protein